MPHRVQTRKSAVSRPKRYRRSSSGWWTVITTRPLGSEVVRAPCLRQKEHVSARSESSSMRRLVSSASSTLPQWQRPVSGASLRGVSRPLIARLALDPAPVPPREVDDLELRPVGIGEEDRVVLRAVQATLFDDVLLETLDERDHVALFGLGYLELRQGRGGMAEEHVPVALADAHTPVDEQHVPAAVVHRSARARAEEVDQELLLALDAVFPAMRPEAAELRIGLEARQKIIRHCRDPVVTTKSLVKALLLVAHRVLLTWGDARDRGQANVTPNTPLWCA